METEEEQPPKKTGLDSCLVAFAFAIIIGIFFVFMIINNIQQQLTMGD